MRYSHLWSRLYGAPLLIHPDRAAVIEAVFRSRITGERVQLMEDDGPTPEQRAAAEHERRTVAYAGVPLQRRDDKPYAITTSGIALIPVIGTLIQRGSWLDALSGFTTYNSVVSLIDRADEDPDVRGKLVEFDTPGGEGAGLIEAAARVRGSRDRKPLWAHFNEQAYSAGYWMGCGAEHIAIPISGGTGSIGALAMFVNQSKRDAMQGYQYEFIFDGARKVDGNSHEPLSDPARAWITAEVWRFGKMFRAHVADMRDIPEEDVQATEAGLLTPPRARAGGYIDSIATLAETVAAFDRRISTGALYHPGGRTAARRSTSSTSTSQKESHMDPKDPTAAVHIAQPPAQPADAVDATKIAADARKAERERISAILGCSEAKGRTTLAQHIANESEMSVDDAKKMLAAAPVEQAAPSNPLAAAMAGVKNPAVGTDTDEQQGGTPLIDASAIYAARAKAGRA